jgi:hypothetical protein
MIALILVVAKHSPQRLPHLNPQRRRREHFQILAEAQQFTNSEVSGFHRDCATKPAVPIGLASGLRHGSLNICAQ